MAEREIDWSTAEVRDATLTVGVTGDAPDDWTEYVGGVLDRLDRGTSAWGEIEVDDDQFEVDSIRRGSESDLRHLLESAVLQGNAHFDLSDDEGDDDREHDEDDEDDEDVDRQMEETFRSFAA
jgi:hypothetical protein